MLFPVFIFSESIPLFALGGDGGGVTSWVLFCRGGDKELSSSSCVRSYVRLLGFILISFFLIVPAIINSTHYTHTHCMHSTTARNIVTVSRHKVLDILELNFKDYMLNMV